MSDNIDIVNVLAHMRRKVEIQKRRNSLGNKVGTLKWESDVTIDEVFDCTYNSNTFI